MAKSKPSEEEILKLGEKIVNELKLEPSVNTLGRWMSHYIAELIVNAENCKSNEEKKVKQKECCDVILQVWQNKEDIPNIKKPMSELEPLIEILNTLKKDDNSFPILNEFRGISEKSSWKGFANSVKNSYENIFELCIYSAINSELLKKKQVWLKEHRNILAKEEKEMLEHLEYLINRSKNFITIFNNEGEEVSFDVLSAKERFIVIFDKIESEIKDTSSKLKELKKTILIKGE